MLLSRKTAPMKSIYTQGGTPSPLRADGGWARVDSIVTGTEVWQAIGACPECILYDRWRAMGCAVRSWRMVARGAFGWSMLGSLVALVTIAQPAAAAQCGSTAAGFAGGNGSSPRRQVAGASLPPPSRRSRRQPIPRQRSRPTAGRELSLVPRPVPRQARRIGHRQPRSVPQAIKCGLVRLAREPLRRAAWPAPRDLGDGDGIWTHQREPEAALCGRSPSLMIVGDRLSPISSMPR